jgi:Putative metallopeptidase
MTWGRRTGLAIALALTAAALPGQAQTDNEMLTQGYIRFMSYHEAGHLLMNQIQGINAATAPTDAIERAADDFATVLLMPDADDDDGVREILGAASAWLRAGPRFSDSDPHAPPVERAEQIVCHIYGSDPQSFATLAEIVQPDWNCEDTYAAMWDEIESNYINKTGSTGVPIEISYQTPDAGLEHAAQFLQDTGILEDLAADVAESFKLIRPTKLMAMNCKAQGVTFHYDSFVGNTPAQNYDRIAVCYELIDMWLKVDFGSAQ